MGLQLVTYGILIHTAKCDHVPKCDVIMSLTTPLDIYLEIWEDAEREGHQQTSKLFHFK